jgi:hypothetical protein
VSDGEMDGLADEEILEVEADRWGGVSMVTRGRIRPGDAGAALMCEAMWSTVEPIGERPWVIVHVEGPVEPVRPVVRRGRLALRLVLAPATARHLAAELAARAEEAS